MYGARTKRRYFIGDAMIKKIIHSFVCFALLVSTTTPFAQYAQGACKAVPETKKCVDTTPCKDIGGKVACLANVSPPGGAVNIPQTCWQFSYDFACTSNVVNTCTQYEGNKACAIVSSNCTDKIPETGQCSSYTNTYNCQTKAETTEQKLSCSSGVFDSSSLTDPNNTNNTFIKAALAQEILRQSATYGKGGAELFAGVSESCKKGYFGIKNCCKSKPGATSNSAMASLAMSAGFSAVKYAGALAVDYASPYVFDAMFQGGEFAAGLAWDFAGSSSSVVVDFLGEAPVGTNFAAGGPSLSAYGFTFQSGVAAQGSGFMGANTTLATFGEGSSMTSITFNPYVFGAMVAIAVIQYLASCTQDEQMLALHKGANLSTFIKEECTKKIPIIGTCIEWTSTYCSFNSVLAKLINIQGKPQLGLGISDCKGLTIDQVAKLDFTKIDFGEFTGQMVQQATKNTPTNMQSNYTPVMQQATGGSTQNRSPSSVIPAYPK